MCKQVTTKPTKRKKATQRQTRLTSNGKRLCIDPNPNVAAKHSNNHNSAKHRERTQATEMTDEELFAVTLIEQGITTLEEFEVALAQNFEHSNNNFDAFENTLNGFDELLECCV